MPIIPILFSGPSQPSTVVAAPAPSASYRTVIVFGDVQKLSLDCSTGSGTRCAEWDASLDWVRDNKTAENIDMVLFVGDLVDAGTVLPPSASSGATASVCDAENGTWTVPMASEATCLAHNDMGISVCEAEPGCRYYIDNAGTTDCLTCARTEKTADEWTQFDIRAARIATGDIGIPWMATKGNHDNPGNENATDTDREPTGWDQRYGAAYWSGLEAGYGGTSVYEHVASNSNVLGDAHAWIGVLDPDGVAQQVLVLAIPYFAGTGISSAMQDWVGVQCSQHQTIPVILVAHDAGLVNTTITAASESFCPNLIWVAGGHTGLNTLTTVVDGSNTVLETVTDWSNIPRNDANGASQDDYITIARFDLSAKTLNAFDYSTAGDSNDSATSTNSFATASFDIDPPAALYDLSAWETELAASFDAKGSARPSWPVAPRGTLTTQTLSTGDAADCTALTTAMAGTSQHVTLTAALTCQLLMSGTDVWLEMTGSGALTSTSAHSFSGTRIKVTGGTITTTTSASFTAIGGTDILFQNVVFDIYSFQSGTGSPVIRAAMINNTITTKGWGWLLLDDSTAGTSYYSDITIANVEWFGGADEVLSGQGVFRVQDTARFLMVDSFLELKEENAFYRTHGDSSYHLLAGNVFAGNMGANLSWIHIYSRTASGDGDILSITIDGNDLVKKDNILGLVGTAGTSDAANDPSGLSSCDDITLQNNTQYRSASDSFNTFAGGSSIACTNLTEGAEPTNDTVAYTGSIYDPMLTCETFTGLAAGCGADH